MAPAQAEGLYEVTDMVKWAEVLAMGTRDSRGMVALFTATWAGPCQTIEPFFYEQAAQYPGIIFVIVDVDDAAEVANACGVTDVPTFQTWSNGSLVEEMSGTNRVRLRALLEQASNLGARAPRCTSSSIAAMGDLASLR